MKNKAADLTISGFFVECVETRLASCQRHLRSDQFVRVAPVHRLALDHFQHVVDQFRSLLIEQAHHCGVRITVTVKLARRIQKALDGGL